MASVRAWLNDTAIRAMGNVLDGKPSLFDALQMVGS